MKPRLSQPRHDQRLFLFNGSGTVRYSVAVVAVLIALAIRLALDPLLGPYAPYLPFTLAVIVAGRVGGLGPAFAATALSTVAVLFAFITRYSLDIGEPVALVGLALFVVVCSLISMLIGNLRDSLMSAAKAEEELRQQAELINLSHDAIITADPERRITGWNVGAQEMYGWTEAEAKGRVIHELLQTRGQAPASDIDAALHSQGRWEGELRHGTRDERGIIVESRQGLLRDHAGSPIGIIETNRDITDRTRADEALRRALEQRRLAMEAADLGFWEYRFDTGEAIWDGHYRAIFGVPEEMPATFEEAIGRIHPEDRAGVEEAVKQALTGANGGLYHREYRIPSQDGSVRWIASHGRAFSESQSSPQHAARLVGVAMDITDRKRSEDRLRETQKMESIGLLAGGVAHDFNNLLTVIMGSASLALTECPACEHSRSILSASERASYLTRQLLAYAGKGEFQTRLLNVSDVVSRSIELLSASVPKRVRLNFDLAKDLPFVDADPSRIEQILLNLVINAGEAIPPKTDGLIKVETRGCEVTQRIAREHSRGYEVAPGKYVCLAVRDNGSGMNRNVLARVFDPFFSTKFTGRGLGLAAVYGIVRSARGFVDVTSSPGEGTTFRVYLPASLKKPEPEPDSTPPPPPEQLRGSSTILVVDDEDMVRTLAAAALRQYGYEVTEAANGIEALELLGKSTSLPSVALIDLAMPVMGGDELAPSLHSLYPGIKIVLTSGFQEEATRQIPSGVVSEFLPKPYTVVGLVEKIAQVIKIP